MCKLGTYLTMITVLMKFESLFYCIPESMEDIIEITRNMTQFVNFGLHTINMYVHHLREILNYYVLGTLMETNPDWCWMDADLYFSIDSCRI